MTSNSTKQTEHRYDVTSSVMRWPHSAHRSAPSWKPENCNIPTSVLCPSCLRLSKNVISGNTNTPCTKNDKEQQPCFIVQFNYSLGQHWPPLQTRFLGTNHELVVVHFLWNQPLPQNVNHSTETISYYKCFNDFYGLYGYLTVFMLQKHFCWRTRLTLCISTRQLITIHVWLINWWVLCAFICR